MLLWYFPPIFYVLLDKKNEGFLFKKTGRELFTSLWNDMMNNRLTFEQNSIDLTLGILE